MRKAYIQPEFEKLTLKSAHDFLNASLERVVGDDSGWENGDQNYNTNGTDGEWA